MIFPDSISFGPKKIIKGILIAFRNLLTVLKIAVLFHKIRFELRNPASQSLRDLDAECQGFWFGRYKNISRDKDQHGFYLISLA